MLIAKLDTHSNAVSYPATISKEDSVFTSGKFDSKSGFQPQSSSDAINFLMSIGDGQNASIQSSSGPYVRLFYPQRRGIDAMATEIFKRITNWPKHDPVIASASSTTLLTSSTETSATSAPTLAPDSRTGPPSTVNYCETLKNCPSCSQGSCPECAASWVISDRAPCVWYIIDNAVVMDALPRTRHRPKHLDF